MRPFPKVQQTLHSEVIIYSPEKTDEDDSTSVQLNLDTHIEKMKLSPNSFDYYYLDFEVPKKSIEIYDFTVERGGSIGLKNERFITGAEKYTYKMKLMPGFKMIWNYSTELQPQRLFLKEDYEKTYLNQRAFIRYS